ncbi:P27 family phage terminase small subunit [Geodermatophilus sp. SYSU D01045]
MRRPSGLSARGRAFWDQAVASYELSESELSLLTEVCRLLDECEELRQAVTRDGTTVAGSTGQTRVHPALGELRQHRLALGKLLAQLALPDEDDETLASPLQVRGRQGAAKRWAGHVKRGA